MVQRDAITPTEMIHQGFMLHLFRGKNELLNDQCFKTLTSINLRGKALAGL